MLISILQTRQAVVSLALIITLVLLASTSPAAAHAGHAHVEDESGFTIIPTLEVAGTVAVLGIAYLLASRFYRSRDGSVTGSPDRIPDEDRN